MRVDQVTLISAALLLASAVSPSSVHGQGHELRVAVHYQLLHTPGTTFPAGVNGELSMVTRRPFVLLGEAGWTARETQVADVTTNARIATFGGGLRLMPADSRFRPFVQVIAGGLNLGVRGTIGGVAGSGSKTWAQLEPGAGFHFDIAPKVAIAGSVHVRHLFLDRASFEPPGENQFRALVGASVQLIK